MRILYRSSQGISLLLLHVPFLPPVTLEKFQRTSWVQPKQILLHVLHCCWCILSYEET